MQTTKHIDIIQSCDHKHAHKCIKCKYDSKTTNYNSGHFEHFTSVDQQNPFMGVLSK